MGGSVIHGDQGWSGGDKIISKWQESTALESPGTVDVMSQLASISPVLEAQLRKL